MAFATPLEPNPAATLARANPVAKLGAALVLLVVLFISLDGVTALVVLAGLVLALPVSGLPIAALLRRSWPIGLVAAAVVLVNALFVAQQSGPTLLVVGPIRIGSQTALEAGGLGLRLLAIYLAGILATATSDPSRMSDALIQQLRVSPRFALGTLAALRLVPLLAVEWRTIGLARRARGVEAGRNPVAAVGLWVGRLVTLLVRAVRRASRLAIAMEARGLGARPCRTNARASRLGLVDLAVVLVAAALGAAAIGISLLLGTWRPLLG